jgi:hypothetical protein
VISQPEAWEVLLPSEDFRGRLHQRTSGRTSEMAREAKLFESVNGSPARALFKLNGNIPPAGSSERENPERAMSPTSLRLLSACKHFAVIARKQLF